MHILYVTMSQIQNGNMGIIPGNPSTVPAEQIPAFDITDVEQAAKLRAQAELTVQRYATAILAVMPEERPFVDRTAGTGISYRHTNVSPIDRMRRMETRVLEMDI